MNKLRTALLALMTAAPLPALADITLYSGRGESFVAPIIAAFTAETGIAVNTRYAGTAELAVLLQEEGANSPADLFWAQDATALGAVAPQFAPLPDGLVSPVPAAYRDNENRWVATSGRGRVLAYSTERADPDSLPDTLAGLTDEAWRGRVAVAPTNGSFLAHVAALRVHSGEEAARAWLEALRDNDPVLVGNNTAILAAIANGEADIGLLNNYYLRRQLAADPGFPVAQTLFATDGDIGNLLLVAGIGILDSSSNTDEATRFVEFLLSPAAQQYFTSEANEYPVVGTAIATQGHIDLSDVVEAAPAVDLNDIGDLEGTLELLRSVGLI